MPCARPRPPYARLRVRGLRRLRAPLATRARAATGPVRWSSAAGLRRRLPPLSLSDGAHLGAGKNESTRKPSRPVRAAAFATVPSDGLGSLAVAARFDAERRSVVLIVGTL